MSAALQPAPVVQSPSMDAQETPVDLWQAIRSRRSVRRYQPWPVAPDLIEKLLLAAMWAPSAHNRQPWRFCVITGEPLKQALARRMGEQWRRDLAGDGVDPEAVARRVAVSHARLTGAPTLIVACLSMADMDVYADPARAAAERTMAVQSVALACQNLLLAAQASGLGACWMCAPLFVPALVRTVLDLPADWEPQALLTVGYPAETRAAERAPLDTRVLWR